MTCSIDGCENKILARGWCRMHYLRFYRTGKPEGVRPNDPPEVRFWAKVKKAGPNDCWEWQAYTNTGGYGRFKAGGNDILLAHRYSYELHHGPIPDGSIVMHSCDNPPCCNPAHLSVGTHKENAADKVDKGRGFSLRGEVNPKSKLTEEAVRTIRASSERSVVLAEQYGVNRVTIAKARYGRSWKHVT